MDFYRRAELVCAKIPWGKVASYGQIALLCGMPKNARQAGYALKRDLAGKKSPAHRVVNAKGILTGAASFETYDMQKLLLEKEGVKVDRAKEDWQVDLRQYGWEHTEEEAISFRREFKRLGI